MQYLFTAQIDATVGSACYQLQLSPVLELEDLKTVVHALVTLRLNFCNERLPLCLVRKLQLVQNMAARLVAGIPRLLLDQPVILGSSQDHSCSPKRHTGDPGGRQE